MGNPIRTRTLHHHMRNPLCHEPFAKTDQGRDCCIEAQVSWRRFFVRGSCKHTAKKKTLAHVDSGTTLVDFAHRFAPRRRKADAQEISCSTGFAHQSGDTRRQHGLQFYPRGLCHQSGSVLSSATGRSCGISQLSVKAATIVFVTRGERFAFVKVLSRRSPSCRPLVQNRRAPRYRRAARNRSGANKRRPRSSIEISLDRDTRHSLNRFNS